MTEHDGATAPGTLRALTPSPISRAEFEPFGDLIEPAADGGEALRHPTMARDLTHDRGPFADRHDVEPRRAARQIEMRVGGTEWGAVRGRLDQIAERREAVAADRRDRQGAAYQ